MTQIAICRVRPRPRLSPSTRAKGPEMSVKRQKDGHICAAPRSTSGSAVKRRARGAAQRRTPPTYTKMTTTPVLMPETANRRAFSGRPAPSSLPTALASPVEMPNGSCGEGSSGAKGARCGAAVQRVRGVEQRCRGCEVWSSGAEGARCGAAVQQRVREGAQRRRGCGKASSGAKSALAHAPTNQEHRPTRAWERARMMRRPQRALAPGRRSVVTCTHHEEDRLERVGDAVDCERGGAEQANAEAHVLPEEPLAQ